GIILESLSGHLLFLWRPAPRPRPPCAASPDYPAWQEAGEPLDSLSVLEVSRFLDCASRAPLSPRFRRHSNNGRGELSRMHSRPHSAAKIGGFAMSHFYAVAASPFRADHAPFVQARLSSHGHA